MPLTPGTTDTKENTIQNKKVTIHITSPTSEETPTQNLTSTLEKQKNLLAEQGTLLQAHQANAISQVQSSSSAFYSAAPHATHFSPPPSPPRRTYYSGWKEVPGGYVNTSTGEFRNMYHPPREAEWKEVSGGWVSPSGKFTNIFNPPCESSSSSSCAIM